MRQPALRLFASYIREMQAPSLRRAGTARGEVQYLVPELPRAWTWAARSLFLLAGCHRENPSAPGIVPKGASNTHPPPPPPQFGTAPRGHLNPPACLARCRGASESLYPWRCARWIRTWHTVLACGSMPGLISSISRCRVLQDVGPGNDLALL